jgi:hypothetical protein
MFDFSINHTPFMFGGRGFFSTKSIPLFVWISTVFLFSPTFSFIRMKVVRYLRLYPQLFVRELMYYLRYLCLIAHNGVQHILCCVFVFLRLVYPMLSVSSSCVPNVASFFVLCTQCCQFLRLVYPMLPVSSSCVPYVASLSGLFFFIAPSVFSNVYLLSNLLDVQILSINRKT